MILYKLCKISGSEITPGAAPADLPEDCPAEHLFPVPGYYIGGRSS